MLHLVLGRAGSGKSHWMQEMLCQRASEGQKDMVLLVPDQFSFESERALLRRLHASPAGQIEVLSFSRLVTRVLEQAGGLAGRHLDDAGRVILMETAIHGVKDRLSTYGKVCHTPGFLDDMLSAVREWKQCAVSPEQLFDTAGGLEEGLFQKKLSDLALIYGSYNALVQGHYVDLDDELDRLYDALLDFPFFQGKTVGIDSFKGFTQQQMKIVERIIATAQDTYITLCCDTLHDREEGMGLVSNVIECGRSLMAMADRHGVAIAAPVKLQERSRFQKESLRALEAGLYSTEPPEEAPSDGGVRVLSARTRYDEAELIARTVRRLVRSEGLRYRDIAVISRNAEEVVGILESAFSRYEIPCFLDRRVPVTHQPLMRYLLSAFSVVRHRFETDDVLALLKTGLSGLSLDEVSEIENYLLIWDINRGQWHREWTGNPDGPTDRVTPDQTTRLERLNQWREKILLPLDEFADKVNRFHSPRALAGAVYELLVQADVASSLVALGQRLEEQGYAEEADIQYRTWDLCMGMLSQIEAMLGDTGLDFARFCDLFERMIQSLDLGSVPQGIDEVSVGSAERMRPAQPKAVFLMGCNEGVFPASPASGGLLTDSERARLISLGVPVADRCESSMVEEKFLAYSSACAASEKVILSYCTTGMSGEEMAPSELIRQVMRLFPDGSVEQEEEASLERVESPLPAVEYAARLRKTPGEVESSLRQALLQNERTASAVEALDRASCGEIAPLSPDTAMALYGRDLRPSASGVEDYHRCRFRYFCKHGLRLKTLRTAGLDVSRRGILVHYVLEKLLTQHGSKGVGGLSASQRREEIHRLVEEYVNSMMGGFEDKSARFCFLMRRIEVLLDTLVEHLGRELAQSQFVTAACELRIDDTPDTVHPIRIDLASGGSLQVGGIIDRLDIYRKDDVTYFRVVDYKTGSQSYVLEDVCQGLGLQMLLYLFAVQENGQAAFGDNLRPAGVLYMPAKRISKAADGADDGDALEKLDRALTMNGILLDEECSLRAMEPSGQGLFIPAVYTATGKLDSRRSSVASLAFFGNLQRHIEGLLRAMGNEIQSGRIKPDPLDGLGADGCKYCDFGPACPIEQDHPHRQVIKMSAAEKKELYEGGDFDVVLTNRSTEVSD